MFDTSLFLPSFFCFKRDKSNVIWVLCHATAHPRPTFWYCVLFRCTQTDLHLFLFLFGFRTNLSNKSKLDKQKLTICLKIYQLRTWYAAKHWEKKTSKIIFYLIYYNLCYVCSSLSAAFARPFSTYVHSNFDFVMGKNACSVLFILTYAEPANEASVAYRI